MKTLIINKNDAVFYLDSNGKWHNKYGEFKKKSISKYFHNSIHKDESGFHLKQINGDILEKVYFHYEDTALFVFNIDINSKTNEMELILNTGKKILFTPENLFIKNDMLYMKLDDDIIKFNESCLIKMSKFIDNEKNQYFLNYNNNKYKIIQES